MKKIFVLASFLVSSQVHSQQRIEILAVKESTNRAGATMREIMIDVSDKGQFQISKSDSGYQIKKFVFDRNQVLYYEFLKSNQSEENFNKRVKHAQIDAANQVTCATNSVLYVLVNKKGDSIYQIVPDLNFNHDFRDDKSFMCKVEGSTELNCLIKFDLVNKGTIFSRAYEIGFDLSFNVKASTSNEFSAINEVTTPTLSLAHRNSLYGSFVFNNSKYELEAIPQFLNGGGLNSFLINISDPNHSLKAWDFSNSEVHRGSALIAIAKFNFRVDSIDIFTNKIYLSVLPQ